MENIKEILTRLCLYYDVSNNRKLADKIGINYNTISTWIKRKSIPYDKLHNIVQKESISFDWLLTGKGSMHLNEDENGVVLSGNDITTGHIISNNVNGNIHINSTSYDNGADIEKLVMLLKYAPSDFIKQIIKKLEAFKELSRI